MPHPFRTNETNLTDDELLVLDFAFQIPGAGHFPMTKDEYGFHLNCGYTHGLSNSQVQEVLDRFVACGWLSMKQSLPWDTYYLTAEGGSAWESERQPDWDRFCVISIIEPMEEEENWRTLQVNTLSLDALERALEVLIKSKRYLFQRGDVEVSASFEHSKLAWKEGIQGWCAAVPLAEDEDLEERRRLQDLEVDRCFLKERSWWSSMSDLVSRAS